MVPPFAYPSCPRALKVTVHESIAPGSNPGELQQRGAHLDRNMYAVGERSGAGNRASLGSQRTRNAYTVPLPGR